MATVYLRVADLADFETIASDIEDVEVHLLADGADVRPQRAGIPVVISEDVVVPGSLFRLVDAGKVELVTLDDAALAEIRRRFGC